MRIISLLPTAFATLFMVTVHAAPAKQLQGPTLSCDWYDQLPNGQLSAGDYNYGGNDFKLGYKYFDQDDGTSIMRVVKVDPNDPSIYPLSHVIQVSCNSTALNYYGHPGQFGANIPVKLRAGVGGRDAQYCVGIHDPDTDPTDIVLVPCSETDDESQANQFWMQQFKYGNLLPLIGKSNTSANVEHNNTWPILRPADDANLQIFRAGHSADEGDFASLSL